MTGPRCAKVSFASRREALEALASAQASNLPWRRELRVYVCWHCSGDESRPIWHLTSEPLTPPMEWRRV